ncbi:hypothetical protein HDU76_013254, partial [Blyttiomyces sp. JEL0837]
MNEEEYDDDGYFDNDGGVGGSDEAGGKRKRITQACDACNRKKIKCDGQKPSCSHCSRSSLVCTYSRGARKRGPRAGYIESLENRLKEMEALLRPLQPPETGVVDMVAKNMDVWPMLDKDLPHATTRPLPPGLADRRATSMAPGTSGGGGGGGEGGSGIGGGGARIGSPASTTSEDNNTGSNAITPGVGPSGPGSSRGGSAGVFDKDIGGGHGGQGQGQGGSASGTTGNGTAAGKGAGGSSSSSSQNAAAAAAAASAAAAAAAAAAAQGIGVSSSTTAIPPDAVRELLDLYFHYIYPFMPLVHKNTFMANFANESPLLLNAMYALAARFSEHPSIRLNPDAMYSAGDVFYIKARELVDHYMDVPTASTVSALLLLATYAA